MKKLLENTIFNQSIEIVYLSNPNKVVNDHIGNYFDMVDYTIRKFPDKYSAINFLMECTRPLTNIEDLLEISDSLIEIRNSIRNKRLLPTEDYLYN